MPTENPYDPALRNALGRLEGLRNHTQGESGTTPYVVVNDMLTCAQQIRSIVVQSSFDPKARLAVADVIGGAADAVRPGRNDPVAAKQDSIRACARELRDGTIAKHAPEALEARFSLPADRRSAGGD